MGQRYRLTNIPPHIQKMYGIGPEVEVLADNTVCGGHFTLTNTSGQEIGIDAVELSGTGILMERLG